MHPILLSILLGLTAAAANVFGGAIIVQKNWDRSYLKYFVALGAGFMLATAIVEIFPASLELRGKSAAVPGSRRIPSSFTCSNIRSRRTSILARKPTRMRSSTATGDTRCSWD